MHREELVVEVGPHQYVVRARELQAHEDRDEAAGHEKAEGGIDVACKVAGLRSPDEAEIQPLAGEIVHDARCRRTVAERQIAGHVFGDAVSRERMPGRRRRHVVADELQPDAQAGQSRIGKRAHQRPVIRPLNENEARAVMGACGERTLEPLRHADQHVAHARTERFANEVALHRMPCVRAAGSEIARDQLGDAILESAAVAVRVREVIGIGAHAQLFADRPAGR